MDAKLPQTQMDKKTPFISVIRVPESQTKCVSQVARSLTIPT